MESANSAHAGCLFAGVQVVLKNGFSLRLQSFSSPEAHLADGAKAPLEHSQRKMETTSLAATALYNPKRYQSGMMERGHRSRPVFRQVLCDIKLE